MTPADIAAWREEAYDAIQKWTHVDDHAVPGSVLHARRVLLLLETLLAERTHYADNTSEMTANFHRIEVSARASQELQSYAEAVLAAERATVTRLREALETIRKNGKGGWRIAARALNGEAPRIEDFGSSDATLAGTSGPSPDEQFRAEYGFTGKAKV